MANLSITSADVHLVREGADEIFTGPLGEDSTGGQYIRLNTTTGYLEHGNGSSAGELGSTYGVLIDDADAGLAGTIALPGAIVDLGDALTGMAFDAPIYASDTDATLADSAGTVSRVVGRVVPGYGFTTSDKLMKVV